MTVKSNLYAKYYFELRALFKDNEKEFPLKPLDKNDAIQLELNSNKYKNKFEIESSEISKSTTDTQLKKKPEWVCWTHSNNTFIFYSNPPLISLIRAFFE